MGYDVIVTSKLPLEQSMLTIYTSRKHLYLMHLADLCLSEKPGERPKKFRIGQIQIRRQN